ncbi:hypothetical protein OGAPHI_004772 [Ogataea philodendri]|uniref:Uncharacterized protein n=1 Tax=Ogataea philodendri TaxID=1378263 RepID=A0A9P8P1G0_9ASCO|nr:uncharacterized protein OGAPHI_004772 [Ogataea philodendri]KAH3664058.1 hypothetical protein OGAPHI_004772 [Ogataea philodendri]
MDSPDWLDERVNGLMGLRRSIFNICGFFVIVSVLKIKLLDDVVKEKQPRQPFLDFFPESEHRQQNWNHNQSRSHVVEEVTERDQLDGVAEEQLERRVFGELGVQQHEEVVTQWNGQPTRVADKEDRRHRVRRLVRLHVVNVEDLHLGKRQHCAHQHEREHQERNGKDLDVDLGNVVGHSCDNQLYERKFESVERFRLDNYGRENG